MFLITWYLFTTSIGFKKNRYEQVLDLKKALSRVPVPDPETTGPVPDTEQRIWGLSRGNNYSARLGIRGCVSVPARICSNCYFTNNNSCWSFTLLRPPSLIICIYYHTIQTSISLYKRYKIFNGQEWKKKNITRYMYNLSYSIPFIFIFLILIFSIRSWMRGNLLSHQWIGAGFDVL